MVKQHNKFHFAGVAIDDVTLDEACEIILNRLNTAEKGYAVTPNAQHIVLVQSDRDFRVAYSNAFLVLPDGHSIVMAAKLLGRKIKGRSAGSDLFPKICNMAFQNYKKVFFLGGTDGSEKRAAEKFRSLYKGIQIDFYSPSFGFERDSAGNSKIIERINSSKPDILAVFLGTPKSEKWINKNMVFLNVKFAISLGSSIDFFVGEKRRAPKWIQNLGFEWCFRLIQEPRRLWRRYLIGNAIFIWLVIKEMVKKYDVSEI